jgi:hypothetical protein
MLEASGKKPKCRPRYLFSNTSSIRFSHPWQRYRPRNARLINGLEVWALRKTCLVQGFAWHGQPLAFYILSYWMVEGHPAVCLLSAHLLINPVLHAIIQRLVGFYGLVAVTTRNKQARLHDERWGYQGKYKYYRIMRYNHIKV